MKLRRSASICEGHEIQHQIDDWGPESETQPFGVEVSLTPLCQAVSRNAIAPSARKSPATRSRKVFAHLPRVRCGGKHRLALLRQSQVLQTRRRLAASPSSNWCRYLSAWNKPLDRSDLPHVYISY